MTTGKYYKEHFYSALNREMLKINVLHYNKIFVQKYFEDKEQILREMHILKRNLIIYNI